MIYKSLKWEIQSVSGINDRGQIIGTAEHNGHQCVFLLSPETLKTK
ncbi:hypothetical protein IAD21_04983 [Abditibacteriota bacterium]|nr:hypothetical protein IAD21_04983 [Abditibacteriota bacterium]